MNRVTRTIIALTGRLAGPQLAEDVMGNLEEVWRRDAVISRRRAWRNLLAAAASLCWHRALDRARPLAGEAPHRKESAMHGWMQDLRYGLRGMRRAPGITALIVFTMALGIGANSAVFSAVYAVLLKPLPYHDPGRIVLLTGVHDDRAPSLYSASQVDFEDWQRSARSFESMASFAYWTFNLTGTDLPVRLTGGRVTPAFFELLGTPALLGRTVGAADDSDGATDRIVLSHALWSRVFGADPAIVGRTLSLNGVPSEVVGVMPASFRFPDADVELWAPLGREMEGTPRSARFQLVVARLAPGVTRAAAQHEMNAIADDLARRHPDANTGWSIGVAGARASLASGVRQPLLLLLLASGLVLAIACANLANLLLARASVRRRECAIRAALGASRAGLVRQFLLESLLLAGLGGLAGLIVARWGLDALVRLQPGGLPRIEEIALHPVVLAFTLGCTLLAGILFGIVPAFHVTSEPDLRDTSSTTTGRRGHQLRRTFVVAEIALACVLVVAGLLLTRSFGRVAAVDPGFEPTGLAAMRVFLGPPRYRQFDDQNAFIRRALERLRALPTVSGAAAGTNLPLGDDVTREPIAVEGRADLPERRPRTELRAVTPGYFQLLGIPLLDGRDINDRDTSASEAVFVINRNMARALWPGERAIGKRVRWAAPARDPGWMTVVGVVGDAAGGSLEEPEGPVMYAPYEQRTITFLRRATLVVRTSADAAAMAQTARRALRDVDADLPVYGVEALDARFDRALAPRRFGLLLLGLFSGLALLVALAGVYGVVAFGVAERRRELSMRLVLGAAPRDVFGLVVRDGLRLIVAGLAIGLGAAWIAGRQLESLLFGVTAHDALSFVLTAGAVSLIALAATVLPAWHSMRIAPSEVLRDI